MVAINCQKATSPQTVTFNISQPPKQGVVCVVANPLFAKWVLAQNPTHSDALQVLKAKQLQLQNPGTDFVWCKKPDCGLCFFNKDK